MFASSSSSSSPPSPSVFTNEEEEEEEEEMSVASFKEVEVDVRVVLTAAAATSVDSKIPRGGKGGREIPRASSFFDSISTIPDSTATALIAAATLKPPEASLELENDSPLVVLFLRRLRADFDDPFEEAESDRGLCVSEVNNDGDVDGCCSDTDRFLPEFCLLARLEFFN